MPCGEYVAINVGDTVRIHPNYENYKFKKLKHDVVYRVDEVDKIRIKSLVGILSGDTIHLNMDKSYFEHVGKEEQMERNYNLEIGDVVLIQNSGYGFVKRDVGKYVEVVEYGDYYGEAGVKIVSYDEPLETKNPGDEDGVVGYGTFGEKPMILLNTNDEHFVDEDHTVVAEGSKQQVDEVLGIKRELVNKPKHYELFEDVEAIEVIARSLTKEEFRGYCFGNLLKYRLRCGKKDSVEQELAKADKYKELYEKYKDYCHE